MAMTSIQAAQNESRTVGEFQGALRRLQSQVEQLDMYVGQVENAADMVSPQPTEMKDPSKALGQGEVLSLVRIENSIASLLLRLESALKVLS